MTLPGILRALVPDVIACRDARGWNAVSWETLPVKLMCVVAELHELELALAVGSDECAAEEIADVAIYLLVVLHDLFDGGLDRSAASRSRSRYHAPEVLTAETRRYTVMAFESWRRDDRKDAGICCELALLEAARLSIALGIDLRAAVQAKTDKNWARPVTHGGKHPDS